MSEEYYKNRCIKLDAMLDRVLDSHTKLEDKIKPLQQENQQLKEQLKDENNYHNEAVKWYKEAFDIEQERIKYKSVLDEIREQTKSGITSYNYGGSRTSLFEVLVAINEILDKVKE